MIVSLLHATYGRPEKARAAMRMAFERAANPKRIEYIFACNAEDAQTLDALRKHRLGEEKPSFSFVTSDFSGSAPAWQGAALVSAGDLLIQQSDDLELPHRFDEMIVEKCERYAGKNWNDKPCYIAVGDGFRRDNLCTCAVMNRKYYELAGHFIPPMYRSVHSDGEVTFRAMERSRSGDATFVDARDIIMLHRHHFNDPTVPWDDVYARGNSPEAYEIGLQLLLNRNLGIAAEPGVNWL